MGAQTHMGKIVSRSADRVLRWRLLLAFATGLLDTASAYACSFVDEQAAATHAEAVAGKYWIASILLGGVLIGLELHQRQGWRLLVLTVTHLIFHPYWTLPPVHGPDCVFVNVENSQFVLTIISLMFAYRLLSRGFVRRHRVTVGVAGSIGVLAVSTAVILPGFQQHGLPSARHLITWLLPGLLPVFLLSGFTTGFAVAALLGTTSLVKRMVRLRTKGVGTGS
jgi:NhaP-type Na+/H+ or K+/H+ antiporter